MDEWLMARLRANQGAWRQAMSSVSLREGVMARHFEMLADWNWYRRRAVRPSHGHGVSHPLGPDACSRHPHIAEEFWQRMGGKRCLPATSCPTGRVLAGRPRTGREAHLRVSLTALATCASSLSATPRGDQPVVIQTAAAWKSELARDALRLHSENFDFKAGGQAHVQSLEVFENEALRGEIFQTWMALTTGSKKKRGRVHSWSDSERILGSGELDETSIIAVNSDFIPRHWGSHHWRLPGRRG
ncbi:MAG: hypothetical protein Ct9H300mP30_3960 [Methanobacteriota archaeon]|nr:MAG: hypothetical protein Ct9H300mP30_3960 [Euryarchaeota archaeon]